MSDRHEVTPPPQTEPTEKVVNGEDSSWNVRKRSGDDGSHEEEPPKKKFHLGDIVPTKLDVSLSYSAQHIRYDKPTTSSTSTSKKKLPRSTKPFHDGPPYGAGGGRGQRDHNNYNNGYSTKNFPQRNSYGGKSQDQPTSNPGRVLL